MAELRRSCARRRSSYTAPSLKTRTWAHSPRSALSLSFDQFRIDQLHAVRGALLVEQAVQFGVGQVDHFFTTDDDGGGALGPFEDFLAFGG